MRRWPRERVNDVWKLITRAVRAAIGVTECVLIVGLAFVVIALWPLVGRVALLPVGLVMVWVTLPVRSAFIHRSPGEAPARRKS
jgi:hypothetical protein